MNTFKYMRKNLILLSVIAIFFLFSNTVFCEEDYDPEKILQIPHQNILNNESLPGTTGNTGALSFSIPIKVPPGKGGLQPELSLTYNSNSKRNGWVGVGWSLELDSIQRSTKTPMKLNDNDSFVYNGSVDLIQRTQWGNNYYGARIEGDFTKFNYLGSSTGWVIYLADGSKKFFGSSPESRVLAYNPYPWPGQRTTFKWLLDRIEDPNGNSISITYNNTTLPEGTSEYYINQINYSPGSSIKFIPEVRPDRHPVYNNYGRLEFTKRLKTIEVYGSGQQAHKYSLNYSTGHYGGTALESVQEYGSNFGSTVLPKTSFNYEPGADFTFDSKKTKTTEFENGMGLIHFADINGDGIKDLVKFQTRTPTRSPLLRVFLGANDGSFGSPIVYDTNAENIAGHIHFGDINGDGRADLLKSNTNETAIRVYLASSTVEGSFDYIGERSFSAGLGKTRLADVNGDGLPDLIELLNGWDGEESYGLIRVHISDGSGGFETNTIDTDIEDDVSAENCSIADPNGDGLSDIIIKKRWSDTGAGFEYTNSVYVYLANGDGTFGTEWIWNHSQPITTPLGIEFNFSDVLFGDLNGDGLSDLVVPTTHYLDPGNGTLVYTFLSDGFGGFVLPAKIIDTSQTQSFQGQVHVADINGDGFDDLIKFSSIAYPPSFIFNIHYYLGDGKGNFNYENAITSTKWGFGAVIDINGDGLADTLQFKSSDRGIDIYLAKIMSPSNISPDLLVGIDNGYGVTSDIDYKRSVLYPSVHKPSSEYPNAHLPFSTELVDSITINDGIGNSPTTTYDYFGAHYDVREREFLGLKKIIQDNPNNTTLTSEYAVNDYYLKGRAATLNYTDNSDFNLTTSAWEKIVIQDDIQNGFQKGAVWVRPDYINSSITSGGTNVPSNIDYDYTLTSGFGYASTITKSGAGASNHVETNIYANHGAWIWRLTDNRIQQDSTTARHTQFEYNGQGNLTLETHINNNGSNAIIQMPDYDSSGNLLTKIDPNNNTTTFTYYNGTSFLNEKNFEGLITTYSNFNQWGKPRTIVDENTLTTTYTYDNYGRVQKEDYPGPGYKDIVYNDTARPRYTIDRVYDGSGTFADTYKYTDGLDRVLQTTQRGISGANSTMRYSYDGAGRNWQTTGPFFTTDFSYASSSPAGVPYRNITSFDFVDRPRTIQTPHDDGSVATTTINYPGFNRIITDPDGRSTTEGRDFLGRIQTITEANNITSNYDYNAAGDLINVTGPLNNSIVLTRNWLGHITQQDDPDLGIWTYTYKPNGEVLTQTDAKGQVITYDYDSRNRLKTKTYTNVSSPEPQVALAYDIGANGNGKLYSISKGGVVITNAAYNETGQLIQKTMSMDSQNYNIYYNYNPAGQINEITYPDAYSVNYTYHPGTGLISSVSAISPDINITIPSYSAFGKIKTIQYPGFASTLNYFDRTGRLDSINVPSLMAFEYDYTRAGDVLSKYDSIRSLSYTYGYDALHRLTTESAIGPFS
ncbi:MAG: toxin TcdB middle/N-terminal domain-containing protein, partial [Pseudomonadota bacterium]